MDIRKNEPNLTISKKPLKHNRRPKPLTTRQKKKLEPAYTTNPQNKSNYVFPPYNSAIEVPRLIRFRDHNVRYYNEQARHFTKWTYLNSGKSKVCTACGEEKAYSYFDRIKDPKKNSATRRPYCAKCRKKYNREYYLKNKEKQKQTNAAYYEAHKEQSKLTMRKNYVHRTKGRLAAKDFTESVCNNEGIQTTK